MGITTLPYDGDANMGVGLDPTDNKTIWFIGCRGIYSFNTVSYKFTINEELSQKFNALYNDTILTTMDNITAEAFAINEDIDRNIVDVSSIKIQRGWVNHMDMCQSVPINIVAMSSIVYDHKIYLIVSNARAFFTFDLVTKEIDVIYNVVQDRPWFWRPTICNYKDDQLLFMGSNLDRIGNSNIPHPTLPYNLTVYTDIGTASDDDFLESQFIARYEGASCYYDEDKDIMWFMGGLSGQIQRILSLFVNEVCQYIYMIYYGDI